MKSLGFRRLRRSIRSSNQFRKTCFAPRSGKECQRARYSSTVEATQNYDSIVGPRFKNLEGVKEVHEREEIAAVTFEESNRAIRVGDPFELIPSHADTTAKLHDKYYCIRNNKVEAIWPNCGRGLL